MPKPSAADWAERRDTYCRSIEENSSTPKPMSDAIPLSAAEEAPQNPSSVAKLSLHYM